MALQLPCFVPTFPAPQQRQREKEEEARAREKLRAQLGAWCAFVLSFHKHPNLQALWPALQQLLLCDQMLYFSVLLPSARPVTCPARAGSMSMIALDLNSLPRCSWYHACACLYCSYGL